MKLGLALCADALLRGDTAVDTCRPAGFRAPTLVAAAVCRSEALATPAGVSRRDPVGPMAEPKVCDPHPYKPLMERRRCLASRDVPVAPPASGKASAGACPCASAIPADASGRDAVPPGPLSPVGAPVAV